MHPVPFGSDPIAEARRNWERHGWAAPDAMVAATSIARAHQVVLAQIDAVLAPFGLTFSRFEALALLHFSRRGSLPMGKIGARLQVHPASVTNTVTRLERDGLVRRIPGDDDRRLVLAEITPAGRRVVKRASAALAGAEFGLAGLEGGERAAIADALAAVRREAGDLT
jgi:DNA-binding MarR family transcriptional regulator